VPVTLELGADYRAGEAGFAVHLDRLVGSIDERPVRLTRPVEIRRDDGATSLSPARLAVADGWLTAEGRVDEERIDARVEVDRLSLASLDAVIPVVRAKGSVSGRLTLGGTRREPVGELDLRTAEAALTDAGAAARASVSTRLRGQWRAGRCQLEASLREPTGTVVDARGSLPLRLDAETLALSVPPEERVEGELAWSGELGPLWDLLTPNEDRFTGSGALSVQLSGSVAAPDLRGHLEIGEGRYENVLSGTALADLSLRVVGDGERIRLERLTAGDGAQGQLSGRGVVELLPARGYPVELELELVDMLLAARDELILSGGGRLTLTGTLGAPVLRGEIEIGRSELMLAGSLPPEVVELEVEEVRSGVPIESGPAGSRAGAASALALDVRIAAPGRVFARGLGLDSEWSGDLAVGGTAAAPSISGVLSSVRGHFSLMGKRFALKKGAIRFTGGEEVDPRLDLSAERREGSVTAVVQVSGTASHPQVTLTSRPPLPEAEIASQVLFGTGSANLTAAQSLQLASALASYSGIGGPVGILDRTRRAFGVDVIGFAESEQDPDATRVSVGKYISDGVYIEVESGGDESSHTATTVEVEVLPDIRVEGGTTERGSGKVGVKWTWDY
jgi:translocation and assembly module TamB